jgi:hypothetical protein
MSLLASDLCSLNCFAASITITAELEIAGNNFSGAVPSELGSLTSIIVLDASENDFTGTLPNELGMLSLVTSFNIGRNDQMSGTLPGSLCTVTNQWTNIDDCACCS